MKYAFKGRGHQHAYDAFGFHVERVALDFAKVLSGETKLVNPATGLDSVPAAIVAEDIYEIFNVKRGFMITNVGFAVDDSYVGTEPGNVLSIGDNDDDLIIKAVSGDVTADPDFFVDNADLLFGKVYYSGFTSPSAASPVVSSLPGYLAIGDTSIDLTFTALAENDYVLLDTMKLQLWMFGFHVMDGDVAGFSGDLVPFLVP
jgi:hypothetical protein